MNNSIFSYCGSQLTLKSSLVRHGFALVLLLSAWSNAAQGQTTTSEPAPSLSVLRAAQGVSVRDLKVSPDGTTLAVVSGLHSSNPNFVGGHWALFDARTGSLRETHESNGTDLQSLAFSPDGHLLAVGNANSNRFEVWDLASHKVKWELDGSSESVAFSPDGKVLVTGAVHDASRVWDVASGREIKVFAKVDKAVFSPDGRWLAGAGWKYVEGRSQITVTIWDTNTWKPHRTLSGILGKPATLAFSPDSKILAVDSGDEENRWKPGTGEPRRDPYRAQIWDVASGQMIREFIHVAPLQDLAFDPDGKTLLGAAGSVRRWDVVSGKLLEFLPQRGVTKLTFAPDSAIFLGYSNGEVRRWNGRGFAPIIPPAADPVRQLASDSDVFAFTPDGKQLFGVNKSYTRNGIYLGDALLGAWNVADAKQRVALAKSDEEKGNKARAPLFTLPTPYTVADIAVSPDGKWLAAGSEQGDRDTPKSGSVTVWKRNGAAVGEVATAKIDIADTSVMRVGFRSVKRPGGEALAVAAWCSDFSARLFDPQSGESWGMLPRGTVVRHFSPGNRAVHSPIILPQSYQQAKFRVNQSVFSSRANLIAADVSNHKGRRVVLLRPFVAGEKFPQVVAEIDGAWQATFSPDGRWLAVGSSEGAQLWNVVTRRLERILANGTHIEFSPDGNTLAVGNRSYGVTLYDLPALNLGPNGLRAVSKAEADKSKARFPDPNSERKWLEQHPALAELAETPETANLRVGKPTVSADRKTVAVPWSAGYSRLNRTGILVRAVAADGDSFTDKFNFDVPWGEVSQLALSRDGSILASAEVIYESDEKVGQLVRVWDLKGGKLLQTFRTPGASAFSVAVSPDGRLVAAANATTETAQQHRYQIRIWDIPRGQLVREVLDAGYAGNLEFSDDGRALNSYGNNGSVWSLD